MTRATHGELCHALYGVLAAFDGLRTFDMDADVLRSVLSWNDPNGDYDGMTRADLIAALRVQIERAKS